MLGERREREAVRATRGLMGEVARRKEAELQVARARTAAARASLLTQSSALRSEVREMEAAAEAAMRVEAVAETALHHTAAAAGAGLATPVGRFATGDAGDGATFDSRLRTIESRFVHRRPPPSLGAPMLLARWRRLQLGEPIEIDESMEIGGPLRSATTAASAAEAAAAASAAAEGATPRQRVWVRLSHDLRHLELCKDREQLPPLLTWPLVETTHLSMPTARRLHLHSIRGPTLRLVCADGAQLAFWWLGVFDLTSAPAAERASHGLLLWRLAAALYAEEAARRRHHAARG